MNKITTSSAAAQLEQMYDDLNKGFFEGKLPDIIITLKCTKGAYGHFTTGQVWRVDESTHKHEINISSATLDRPILQTAATLLHEILCFLPCQVSFLIVLVLTAAAALLIPSQHSVCWARMLSTSCLLPVMMKSLGFELLTVGLLTAISNVGFCLLLSYLSGPILIELIFVTYLYQK